MQWEDSGIILRIGKQGENSALLSVLTHSHGRHMGMVKGAFSSRLKGVVMTGNQIKICWNARLSEHLGMFRVELENPVAAMIMGSPKRLALMSELLELINKVLPEREQHTDIYLALKHWQAIAASSDDEVEVAAAATCVNAVILRDLGYGIDVSSCAATGTTEDLIYISPKSARAVSRQAGLQYADRMLKLPEFLRAFLAGDEASHRPSQIELDDARNSIGYFINHRLLERGRDVR